jgi:hypothetical protein
MFPPISRPNSKRAAILLACSFLSTLEISLKPTGRQRDSWLFGLSIVEITRRHQGALSRLYRTGLGDIN